MPADAYALPQHQTLTDRLIGIGVRNPSSGLKQTQYELNANRKRLTFEIQNCSTDKLYVKLGRSSTGTGASATDFDFVLKGATTVDFGDGGQRVDPIYKGLVTVYSPGTYRFALIEMDCV